jgi:hypothetical protein
MFLLTVCLLPAKEDARVYIAPVTGGTQEERDYFLSNMRMELMGLGYEAAPSVAESDFYINMTLAMEDNFHVVSLILFRADNNTEIVSLGSAYETLPDMNIWNIVLLVQAMANAPPLPKAAGEGEEGPPWWDKWLWLGPVVAVGYYDGGVELDTRLAVDVNFLRSLGLRTGLGFWWTFPLLFNLEAGYDRIKYSHDVAPYMHVPLLLRFMFGVRDFRLGINAGVNLDLPGSGVSLVPTAGFDFKFRAGAAGALEFGLYVFYDRVFSKVSAGLTAGYKFGFIRRSAL